MGPSMTFEVIINSIKRMFIYRLEFKQQKYLRKSDLGDHSAMDTVVWK